ncbi:hypothetical protein LTR36_007913 [Oleoguttula mirabilis]|uniref:Uncharacterized protein n=1 Tax=Oleoguttula mirabilis TaxID=1507867 RepID=A0AAV9J9G0_9PEZI|nr:hypothetical protein LTR36_007913 [Oleoguttula mirabilis]
MASQHCSSAQRLFALAALCFACRPASALYINGTTGASLNTPQTPTSTARSSTTSSGIGDFVAAGLGLSTTTITETVEPTSRITLQEPSTIILSTTIASPGANSTTVLATGGLNLLNSTTTTTTLASSNSSSSNFTWTGDCWAQWNEYWSASIFDTQYWYNTYADVATTTIVAPVVVTSVRTGTYTTTETQIETWVSEQGAFPVATSTVTFVDTFTNTNPDITITATLTEGTTTSVTTETVTNITNLVAPKGGITTPSCTLPSIVPQCQSQWNAWLNDSFAISDVLPFTCSQSNTAGCASASASWESGLDAFYGTVPAIFYANDFVTPLCTQATLPSGLCSTLVSSFLEPFEDGGRNFAHRSFNSWPSASVLAPGCTLGCQTCAITGKAVRLFYWPPATANGSAALGSGSAVQTIANGSQTVTAVTSGMTFTSPTVYVSYDLLYASDSCSGIGGTYTNIFLPLKSNADLSSLVYFAGDPDVQPGYETRSFNLNDLIAPIPNSIYNQDPRCQASSDIWAEGGEESAFTCPRTASYAPIIAVPTEVNDLDAAWKSCTAWYGGLYDPPKALQGTTVLATPTVPNSHPTTTPASPSSIGLTTTASRTNTPQTIQTSATQASSSNGAATGVGNTVQATSTQGSSGGDTSPVAESTPALNTTPTSDQGSAGQSSDAGSTPQPAKSTSEASPSAAEPSSAATDTQPEPSISAADPASAIISLLGAGSTGVAASSKEQGSTVAAGTDASTSSPAQSTVQPAYPGTASAASETDSVAGTSDPSQTAAAGSGDSGSAGAVSETKSIAGTSDPSQTAAAGSGDPGVATTDVFTFAGVTHTAVASAGSVVVDGSSQQDPGASLTNPTDAASTQIITAAGQTLTITNPADPNSAAAVVNGVSLQSGGPAATISGVVVSAGSGGVVVGGSTTVLPVQSTGSNSGSAVVLTAGGQTLTATQLSGGAVAIGSETVSVGGAAVTYGSVTVSAASNGLQVDGTFATQVPAASVQGSEGVNVVTANGQVLTVSAIARASGNAVAVGGATLSAGGAGTIINGQTVSLVSGTLVVDGTTQVLSLPSTSAAVVTANGQTLTVSSAKQLGSAVVINGATLSQGGGDATINGQTVSAISNGLVVDGTTTLLSLTTAGAAGASETVLTVDGQTLTASAVAGPSGGVIVVNGITLSNGGPAQAIQGITVTAASDGIVADGSTALLSVPTGDASSALQTVLTVDGHTLTASAVSGQSGVYAVDGQTLSNGGAGATVEAATLSAFSGGLVLDGTSSSLVQTVAKSASGTPVTFDGHTLTAVGVAEQTGNAIVVDDHNCGLVYVHPGRHYSVIAADFGTSGRRNVLEWYYKRQ